MDSDKIIIISDSPIPSSSSPLVLDLDLSSTFRDNIRSFLRDYARNYTIESNTVSRLLFASESTGVAFPLYIVQQLISDSHPPDPLCDHCRCVGWGHHYVSKRRYHFIIPETKEWENPLDPLTKDPLKASRNLMHGLIHCNGFGHLLSINTHALFTGPQIFDFWDRLCLTLRTRKISLDDISRKGSMDLRLLHGVAYGRPWFGKWGYKFSHGSFGVRQEHYLRAILILRSIGIDKILEDFSGTRNESVMKMIIEFYRDTSTTPLLTLSDLFQFMLAFSSKTPVARKTAVALYRMSLDDPVSYASQGADENTYLTPSSPDGESDDEGNDSCTDTVPSDDATVVDSRPPPQYDSFDTLAKKEGSRYPARRLKEAAQAVVNVFQERNSIFTRQDLREAVRNRIGDTGLIDYLLKHIDKVLMGDKIVERFTNPESRMLQFSLRTISPGSLAQESKKRRKKRQETDAWGSDTPGLKVDEDIFYLYQNLLFNYPVSDLYRDASEVILDSKSFVKEWPLPSYQEQNLLTVSCQVLPNHEEFIQVFTRALPPGELVVVPQNATIRELKCAAEKVFRDTYCIMDTFEVLEILNRDLENLDDSWVLKPQGKKEFVVKGFGLDTWTEKRYEGGFDDWTVDCKCGAKDDDGERMVACDACKVWHHTQCNSIEDDEAVPLVFLCNMCSDDGLRPKKRSVNTR